MAANSAIEWTDDTWNPLAGCDKISPGCAHCYAERMATRLKAMAEADFAAGRDPGSKRHYLEVIDDKGRWNGKVSLIEEKLTEPLRWRKPRRVFVNSMSDLFHEDVPDDFIDRVFAVMALTDHCVFQVLTKRADRLPAYFSAVGLQDRIYEAMERVAEAAEIADFLFDAWPLPNLWLGVSVENVKHGLPRIERLRQTPAHIRFLSIEPLLDDPGELDLTGIHWVIVGGESGPNARPMHPDWVYSIRDQCQAAGVAFFFKQWGEFVPDDEMEDTSAWTQTCPFTYMTASGRRGAFAGLNDQSETESRLIRIGKTKAGRLLEGREWNEMPVGTNAHEMGHAVE